MSDDKKKFIKLTSPAGYLAKFACLTKEDKKFGGYKCGIVVEDNEASRAFIEKLEAIRDEHLATIPKAKQKKLNKADVYEDEVDDEGDETGRLIINFKSKHPPDLFDAAKPKPNQLEGVDPWTGSLVKVAGSFAGYDMPSTKLVGCTKYMNAVQVIELVSGNRDAASYGFDGVDGGFESAQDDTPFDAGDDDGDDDF